MVLVGYGADSRPCLQLWHRLDFLYAAKGTIAVEEEGVFVHRRGTDALSGFVQFPGRFIRLRFTAEYEPVSWIRRWV